MEELLNQYETVATENVKIWFKAGNIKDFPSNRGGCIKYKNKQIAVFNFERRNFHFFHFTDFLHRSL